MSRPPQAVSNRALALLLPILVALLAGCGKEYYTFCAPSGVCPEVRSGELAETALSLFLVGDAGAPGGDRDRVLRGLSAGLDAARRAGTPFKVVFLGDNIYPNGLRQGSSGCPSNGGAYCQEDRQQLDAQIKSVFGRDGRDGRSADTVAYFVPGNHDWGNSLGGEAYRRIHNQWVYLEGEKGVALVPRGGCPDPHTVDQTLSGSLSARLIFLDTNWLLLPEDGRGSGDDCERRTERQVYAHLATEIANATGPVILLAHHPLRTHSRHGGHGDLLYPTGWSAQDLNSAPYRRLIANMEPLLRQAPHRAVYAAGHDHVLQVLRDGHDITHVISGAGSKLSPLESAGDTEFAAGLPGYIRLDIDPEGRIRLYALAGCPEEAAPGEIAPEVCSDDDPDLRLLFAQTLP